MSSRWWNKPSGKMAGYVVGRNRPKFEAVPAGMGQGYSGSRYKPHQGEQEKARRRRQAGK